MAKKNEIREEDKPSADQEEISSEEFSAEYDPTGRVSKILVPFGLIGSVFVTRAGSKRQLRFEDREKFVLQDGDRITTEDGYFWSLGMSNEKIKFVMFPQCETIISSTTFDREDGDSKQTTRNELTKLELVRGLVWVKVDCSDDRCMDDIIKFPQNYPQIGFKPSNGEWGRHKDFSAVIDLCDNGSVVIYYMSARVVHKKLGLEGRIGWTGPSKGKITVAKDALYVTDLAEHPDPRVQLISKAMNLILQEKLKSSRNPVEHVTLPPYNQPAEQERVLDRQVKRSAKTSEELTDEFWTEYRRKEDEMQATRKRLQKEFEEEFRYAPQATKDREAKILADKMHEMYLEFSRWERHARESYRAKHVEFIETGKKQITAVGSKGAVNKSVFYQNAMFEFLTYETGTEMGLRKAKNDQLFLMIKLKMTNKTNKPIFLEPDESIRLFCESASTPVKLDNYKFETNPDPGKIYEGHLLFLIPADAKNIALEFGKKLGPKQQVRFGI